MPWGVVGPPGGAARVGAGGWGLGAGVSGGGVAVPIDLFPVASRAPNPEPRAPPLLQVFDTYIVFQTDSGVAIVDQHSAHERVLYEQAMRQLTGDGGPAQRLLLPLTLEFTAPELEAIDAHRELLRRVGDEMRELVSRLLTATLPAHDVHGRPTVVQLPKDELERRFGRS